MNRQRLLFREQCERARPEDLEWFLHRQGQQHFYQRLHAGQHRHRAEPIDRQFERCCLQGQPRRQHQQREFEPKKKMLDPIDPEPGHLRQQRRQPALICSILHLAEHQ